MPAPATPPGRTATSGPSKQPGCSPDYDVHWFEEPLPPDRIDDYVALRRQVNVPIAGCEVLTRRQSFLPWLERGAVDVVQPDSTKVGGLSESRRIGWLADSFGISLIPHGWNTAIGLAADLQLASALPATDLVEYICRLRVCRRDRGRAVEAGRERDAQHPRDSGARLGARRRRSSDVTRMSPP